MRLVDLNPRWVTTPPAWFGTLGRVDRWTVGVSFDCPHCRSFRIAVMFQNPFGADGAAPPSPDRKWAREGETFDTMTLSPSVDHSARGHAHLSIVAGEVILS